MQHSLDPRVQRLPHKGVETTDGKIKHVLDQLITFEVFVQPKAGKPFQHEGIVHSCDVEMAYVLAKETFTRRFTCVSLYVTATQHVFASPLTEGERNAYDVLTAPVESSGQKCGYEIYHLVKRGKQHVHAGQVMATGPNDALLQAKEKFKSDQIVYNVWAIPSDAIRFTSQEETDLWLTLPEKKFRDAAEYKGGDRLKFFLEKNKN
jgi:ring-1,2-phenylacetyl-CoA epoxidase subunit PaaB